MPEDLYIGRIVAVAATVEGRPCALYRVSSRSFPNRTAVIGDDKVSIVPKEGHEGDIHKNPYIAYNCARLVCDGMVAVLTNGSQTDPIAEKIAMGVPARDALASVSLALDFEKDQYNTPRVSCVVDTRDRSGWLASIRENGLDVRQMDMEPARAYYVATYEENKVTSHQSDIFPAESAAEAGAYILGQGVFAKRRNPVTAVTAMWNGSKFEFAAQDAEQD